MTKKEIKELYYNMMESKIAWERALRSDPEGCAKIVSSEKSEY